MLALTVGIIFVYSAKVDTSAQITEPRFVKGSNDTTFNFSISVDATSAAAVKRVDVNRPSAFTVVNCPVDLPAAWTCTKDNADLLRFQETITGITAGSTVSFSVNATASGTSGNVTWSIDTYETSGASNLNSSKFNVTIDADAPLIYNSSMNLSDGNVTLLNSSSLALPGGWVKLQDLTFNITITDTVYDNVINASIYYNVSNTTTPQVPFFKVFPHPDTAGSYSDAITLTSSDPATGRYTGTLLASAIFNGSFVTFTIVANDSVGNRNVSNLTTNTYNFTVDGAPPLLVDSPNITNEGDATKDNITTSSAWLNISIKVNDFGGSGVSRVEINASATQGWVNMTQVGTSSTWNYTGALTSLGVTAGDQNLTIHFRAFDNVSNVNGSIATFNVLVDDDAPQFAIGFASPTNTSESLLNQNFTNSLEAVLNFSIRIYGNLNYTGSDTADRSNLTVATIMGPDGIVYNLSFLSKTSTWGGIGNADQMVYSSLWFSAQSPQSGGEEESSLNSTNSTLLTLGCDSISADGGVCPILINATDIFGRSNSSNISITYDNISASVTNISNNATGGAVQVVRGGTIITFSVNANNNIQNVTIHNASISAQLNNATVLTDLGTSNYSIALSANQLCSGGIEGWCTVNFSVVDKAYNLNRSGILNAKAQLASTTFIVDNSAPLVSNFLVEGTNQYENRTGTGTVRLARSDLNLTITFNVSDEQTNVTQANIGNATLRNASFATEDIPDGFRNDSTLANFGCPTNVEGVSCILVVHTFDNVSINSIANENNSVNLTFQIDDLAPRVLNFSTNIANGNGRNVTSVSTVINFSVNITDANLQDHNVTISSASSIKMNKTGSFNVNATGASNSSAVTWWAMADLNSLGCTTDGDCTITVVANDSAGNVNDSVSIVVTSDSSRLAINNLTTDVTFNTSTPTFYVNTSVNALCRYSTTGVINYSQMSTQFTSEGSRHNYATLSATSDGSYTYRVSCVDVSGSNVATDRVTFTISAAPSVLISNLTSGATFISSKPTIYVNTSGDANCRYSTTGVTNYSEMSTQFTTQGSRHNSFTLVDTLDNDYTNYKVSCVNTLGGDAARETATFTIDTTSLWNITIGATGALSATKDYFTQAKRFYTFKLPKTNILDTTAVNTTFNVTNVLASVMGASPGTAATNNLSIIYAYNRTGNSWTSFVYGRATNTFTNFTSDVMDYYVNFTVANERIEIN